MPEWRSKICVIQGGEYLAFHPKGILRVYKYQVHQGISKVHQPEALETTGSLDLSMGFTFWENNKLYSFRYSDLWPTTNCVVHTEFKQIHFWYNLIATLTHKHISSADWAGHHGDWRIFLWEESQSVQLARMIIIFLMSSNMLLLNILTESLI